MARPVLARPVWLLLAALLLPAVARAASPDDVRSRVVEELGYVYVHGVDEPLARDLVDRLGAGVPVVLRELLADPAFPRRDNVVAFLAHLGGPADRDALLRFMADPPAGWSTPEEDRALLMAPTALGPIARRGDAGALEALLRMTDPATAMELLGGAAAESTNPEAARTDLIEKALRGLAWAGTRQARDRLLDVGLGRLEFRGTRRDLALSALRSLDLLELLGTSSLPTVNGGAPAPAAGGGDAPGHLAPRDPAPGSGVEPQEFDVNPTVTDSSLTYANHVDHNDPMTDTRLDESLAVADLRAGRSDYDGDVACCMTLSRLGTAQEFGTPGDGLDSIDDSAELNEVMGNPVARIKVVREIHNCGGPGFGIIGCGNTPGDSIAVVRMSSAADDGLLWAHEYGHNTGLGHNGDNRRIMHGFLTGSNRGLTQGECDSFHAPPLDFLTNSIRTDTGACTDNDGDEVQDGVDNCPANPNNNQLDDDGDGVGSTCDNCASDFNPDQANFDLDAEGDVCDFDDDNDGVADGSDCAPLDASVSSPAGEAQAVGWPDAGKTTLGWTTDPEATESNVYRGDFGTVFDPAWTCLAAGVIGDTYDDVDVPAAGEGFHYLVSGENGCGESGVGQDSDGVPRVPAACP